MPCPDAAYASNAIFVMTSNIGGRRGMGFRSDQSNEDKDRLLSAITSTFSPEFVNRIDEIIAFRSLNPDDVGRIARPLLQGLGERLTEQGLTLEPTDAAIKTLVQMGFDDEYGGRPLRRVIEQQVENALGGMILRGDIQEGQIVFIDSKDGKIVIRAK